MAITGRSLRAHKSDGADVCPIEYLIQIAIPYMARMFAIEFIRTAAYLDYRGCDDLPWQSVAGHDNYETEEAAEEAVLEFDAAFDGAYVHRYVAREVD